MTGLPNPPCCLTEERAAAVSASSSTSLRYVPLRPMNLAPSSALSSPAPVFPARATVETRLARARFARAEADAGDWSRERRVRHGKGARL